MTQGWLNVPSGCSRTWTSAQPAWASTSPWLSGFSVFLGDGRWKNRLDAIQDKREGVALLTRNDLGQGEGHRQGQGVRRLHLLQPQRSRLRHSGTNQDDRREGPGYPVVPSLQTLPPGEFIQRNIMRAVECSKRTVLVLSRNFLESEWCLLEFSAAHVQALKDHVPRVIIIKLEDLPKDDELPKEIQLYLKNTTYLTWGEKHFWDNLLYVLPKSQSIPKPKSQDDARFFIPMANLSA
ncbi:toll-like receptor Tollo [Caerostris extrusa]|uniref:Toll-like receptor Tollo n=1 Tax=Caerostris extrusa TaxID=172846 RepID=A0AAV4N0D3_CAEEX|nr:toll-like receptor Tollo [Caerostris extrusa]